MLEMSGIVRIEGASEMKRGCSEGDGI
jgi:hypothetical protein